MDQVAQLLQSVSAGRPTEQVLQNDIRRLNVESKTLHAGIQFKGSLFESSARAYNADQISLKHASVAYTALKRSTMMKDVIAMYKDYVPKGTAIGSQEHKDKKAQLIEDITDLHDNKVAAGMIADAFTHEDVGPFFCNLADTKWLKDQLQHDDMQRPFNIWSV